jgi:hypothetical protein
MATQAIPRNRSANPREKSTEEGAKKLTDIAERAMERKGLSEEEKAFRVGRFTALVDLICGRRARR